MLGLAWAAAAVLATFSLAGCEASRSLDPRRSDTGVSGHIDRAVDGDTISVRLKSGTLVVVRQLAIDSPEKYGTRYGSPDECGSAAASRFMEAFEGSAVRLVSDSSQSDRDRFGRLLRYIDLASGTDLGAAEVRAGLAVPFAFDARPQRIARYERLAHRAAASARGTWGSPCDGDFHSSLAGVQDSQ